MEPRIRAPPDSAQTSDRVRSGGRRESDLSEGSFITELQRRRVFRVLVGYGVVAFAVLQGRNQEALAEFDRSNYDLWRVLGWVVVSHTLGDAAASDRALAELLSARYMPDAAYQAVQAYAWRGELDQAFLWLDSAIEVKDFGLSMTKRDPLLRKLRQDPRYAAALARMKLPPD